VHCLEYTDAPHLHNYETLAYRPPYTDLPIPTSLYSFTHEEERSAASPNIPSMVWAPACFCGAVSDPVPSMGDPIPPMGDPSIEPGEIWGASGVPDPAGLLPLLLLRSTPPSSDPDPELESDLHGTCTWTKKTLFQQVGV
jgi:hypothetical protein